MEIRYSGGEVMRESEVVYYSYKTPWNFLQQIIKSMLRRLGFTSETKHQSPPDSLNHNQTQGVIIQSTEATFVVTSRSVARTESHQENQLPPAEAPKPTPARCKLKLLSLFIPSLKRSSLDPSG